MVFSSIVFIFLFLPIFLGIYFIIKKEYQNLFILIASLLFYFWGEGKYVLIMILYMVCNYFFGIFIEKYKTLDVTHGSHYAKKILTLGLVFNIGLLVFFKYFNFIVTSINWVLEKVGHFQLSNPEIHLPIGISFFTFQAISYIVDVYRRDIAAQKNIIDFSMYKALFPQLIAGPIVRYKDIAKQVSDRTVTIDGFSLGIQRFIIGLAKKVLIANTVGVVADAVFATTPSELSFGVVWLGVIAYSIQIFFDFSGYSDMAIGLGKMMGFDFLENFNYPYISKSIREVWQRWHISLSSWFRDYLYIPLGGNKMGKTRNYFNLLFVFFLCGLWHGASWLFVIWGCWHGLFLVLERTSFGKFLAKQPSFFQHTYTLIIIMFGWTLFRSETLIQAIHLLKNMTGFYGVHGGNILGLINFKILLAFIFGILLSTPVFEILKRKAMLLVRTPKFLYLFKEAQSFSLILLFILCVIVISSGTYNPFIYFRF